MPVSELLYWQAFDSIDPVGDERGDLHAGIIAAQITAAAGVGGVTPADFMPFSKDDRPQRSAKEMFAGLVAKTIALGGKVVSVKNGK